MKINVSIFFTLCFISLSFSQELIVKSSFENIEYVEDVEWYNEDIYCAGYTFKTKLNDGNSTDAYLINYDTSLKPKWVLRISDKQSNKIYSIKRYKDKIYALITQGEEKASSQDVFITLFIITLDGVIESKESFGRTFHSPSNIAFDGDNLIFGNKVSDGISYSSNSVSEIIKYNIITKKIERFKSNQYLSRPKKIISENSNIFLFGIYLHKNQSNIMTYKNGKYAEISLKPNKEEYFLDSYINENILTVVCAFPGVYGDLNKYLKFYYVNINDNTIKFKTMPYTELGWSDVRFDTFSTKDGSWLIIQDQQTKMLKHVLIDRNGKVSKILNYDEANGNGYKEKYIFKDGMLLNANSRGIKLYKI
jgi:hypothetical protein